MNRLLCVLFATLFPLLAVAAPKSEHKPVDFDPAVFAEQRGKLIEEISRGERYREIGDENREKVVQSLDAMGVLLANVTSISQLNEKQKVELFNHQEQINSILTQAAEDSRLICSRETPLGSHRQVNVCKTVAQRRQESERSRDMLRNRKNTPLPRSN